MTKDASPSPGFIVFGILSDLVSVGGIDPLKSLRCAGYSLVFLYSWSDLEEKNGTRERLKREIILSFLHDANMTIDEIDSAFLTVNILSSYD